MKLLSFAVIEKDNHFLLIYETSKKWKGTWFFPGGHVAYNEDPVSAVIRETKEEAKCNLLLDGIFYFNLEKKFLVDKLEIFYHGRTDESTIKNKDEQQIKSKWFSYDDIAKLPLRENALLIIDSYRALKNTIPIYNFNLIKPQTPDVILKKEFKD